VDGDRVERPRASGRSIGGLCLARAALRRRRQPGAGDPAATRWASGSRTWRGSRRRRVVMMIPIPGAGVLRAVEGQAQARAVEGIVGVEITIARGRPVVPLPDGGPLPGFPVRARKRAPTRSSAPCAPAHGRLRIRIEPHAPSRSARASVGSPVRVLLNLGPTSWPPAVARRLAGGLAAPRRARRPLPGFSACSRGIRRPGVTQAVGLLGAHAHRHASGAQRRAPSAREHPGLPICFYGLYCPRFSRELVERELAARAIAGEYEPALRGLGRRAGGPVRARPGRRTADHPPAARQL